MPKVGRRRKKNRTHVVENEAPQSALTAKKEELKVPKSLVMRRGKTAPEVGELVTDLRHLMLPYTALHFQEDPKNRKLTLSQYATNLALPMGITHMMSFSQNDERLNMRLARTPEGPTLSFRIHQFSLTKHIKKLQKRPVAYTASLSSNPPIVVTNNFGDAAAPPHVKLMRITFQNMFPATNVSTVRLSECRRVVLFHLLEAQEVGVVDGETRSVVQMRHYAIRATPVGVNRRIRRIVKDKLPNLSKCQDIADYLGAGAISDGASDSEPEEDLVVQLPDKYVGKGNTKAQKSALKLVEIGPRLSMELVKVEKGLGAGDVLYHAHVQKSPEEAAALKARKEREAELKMQRKALQQANVERKRKAAEEKKEAKKQRKAEREKATLEALRQGRAVPEHDDDDDDEEEEEEDNH
ncbi:ribosome biogenesis protein SSF1/2 [Fistulifera solaris]|uniref:Ribosome biogenesis protein SSF1/2 n=1 Tax=Fistulifera solaris TaxID=1519565 RepID=A0A1Z5JDK4_FISSO|nr:ribosome biogenesis protein SSF1/2 [Fistulifera solaris]|eukprot:GAX11962.1 ribosome biogenesis protein SSF1/2 [Fistulifera solaris]